MSTSITLAPSSDVVPDRPKGIEVARPARSLSPANQTFRSVWFAMLLGSICLEGLGRRYLPAVPSTVFYFAKDVVLILGLIRFRINRDVRKVFSSLYGGFAPFLKLALLWTLVEIVNPDQQSLVLGLLGFRAYWFWWIAPLVVASVLLDPVVRRKVVMLQAGVTAIVAILAIFQFGAPVDDTLNTYSIVDGEAAMAATVATTGRPRVSSTFSYLSGFTDFAALVPVLLLSVGLGEKNRRARLAALIATLLIAAALPMSGSRGPFVLSLVLCGMVAWRAGLIFTPTGRRVIMLAVAAGFISVYAYPEALQGTMDRFQGSDTDDRVSEFFTILPPVALYKYSEYPVFGIGTGMVQNYRQQFGVNPETFGGAESEVSRLLVELGVGGYLLIWIARLGLVVVLWRSSKILMKAGRRAASAAAVAYAFLGFYGSLVFDHIYAALFFVGFGFILQEVVQARLTAPRNPHHEDALARNQAPLTS
jgi:O-antigen ligase